MASCRQFMTRQPNQPDFAIPVTEFNSHSGKQYHVLLFKKRNAILLKQDRRNHPMDHQPSPHEWIKKFTQGDPGGYQCLHDEFYNSLYTFALKLVSNTHEAQDVVEDAFHKIWERHQNFKLYLTIRRFLYTTVRNSCMNILNRRKLHNCFRTEQLYCSKNPSHFTADDNSVNERKKKIFDAINTLPPQCRTILLLILDGKETRDIARQLNIEVQTVRNHKTKSIQLIRVFLAGLHADKKQKKNSRRKK